MRNFLILTLTLLMLLGTLTACTPKTPDVPEQQTTTADTTDVTTDEVTTQPESEIEVEIRPATPPECAQTPEQIVQALASDQTVMQIGMHTREVLLPNLGMDAVRQAFEAAGYAVTKPLPLPGAEFETVMYYSTEAIVTLQKTEDSMHLTWEPYQEAALSLLFANEKTGTGEVTLLQMGMERVDEDDNPLNGMCYVYKLSDGSAVIIDGGFNNKYCRQNIMNALEKLGIIKDADGKYVITAWIFSHGHSDHRGAFTGIGKNFGDRISLKYLLYNFPVSPGTLTASTFDLENFENKWAEYYPGVQHIVAHAGYAYHFDNLTVEVLYSPEMLYSPDQNISYYNDTSLIMIADCSGTRTLFMGDAGEVAATMAWSMYEQSAFRANMIQITHHGFNTGDSSHKWKNIKQIYNATDATFGLLPMAGRYEASSRNGRHTVIIGHTDANYQMSFFANKRDRHEQSTISEAYFASFVESVAAGTNTYPTLFGYDGINTIDNGKGLITYIAGNDSSPMGTVFTLNEQGVTVTHNQVLSEWFADLEKAD